MALPDDPINVTISAAAAILIVREIVSALLNWIRSRNTEPSRFQPGRTGDQTVEFFSLRVREIIREENEPILKAIGKANENITTTRHSLAQPIQALIMGQEVIKLEIQHGK